ncbi:MAG TPA: hypothetical protein VGS18_04505 [Thermoplasmata archaeon]|nr:hypothetical protein [Thermoplasmata archaeon]
MGPDENTDQLPKADDTAKADETTTAKAEEKVELTDGAKAGLSALREAATAPEPEPAPVPAAPTAEERAEAEAAEADREPAKPTVKVELLNRATGKITYGFVEYDGTDAGRQAVHAAAVEVNPEAEVHVE